MSLDTSTLYLVAAMVAAMLGAMLLFVGSQENIPALRWWGTAYLLGAASIALWTLAASSLGEMLSLALNAVGFLAPGPALRRREQNAQQQRQNNASCREPSPI